MEKVVRCNFSDGAVGYSDSFVALRINTKGQNRQKTKEKMQWSPGRTTQNNTPEHRYRDAFCEEGTSVM